MATASLLLALNGVIPQYFLYGLRSEAECGLPAPLGADI